MRRPRTSGGWCCSSACSPRCQNGPSPSSSGGNLRFAITVSGNSYEQQLSTTALTVGTWTHVAVTISNNSAVLYVNGSPAVSSTTFTNTPARVAPVKNYLGKSQFAGDPFFNGRLDQVEIADYALSAAQIAALAGSAQVPTITGSAASTVGYLTGSGNLTLTGGALALGGELRIGGSDQNGSQFNATGAVTVVGQ